MIKSIYTAEASMRPKMTRMEVLANNLANINSTGFKKDKLFVQMLQDNAAKKDHEGEFDGVAVQKYVDFTEGSLNQTGNPLDLALQGRGFFAVETNAGTRYTRAGSFRFDNQGTLVTNDNQPVLGVAGHIRLPQGKQDTQDGIRILETGEIMQDKNVLGQLRIVDFADTSGLVKEGDGFFTPGPGQVPTEVTQGTTAVRQGYLEESNVDGIVEMLEMIELNRGFETDQKSLQSLDTTVERSLDIGRV
jgi:flagellar basal-body rod protein FlgF